MIGNNLRYIEVDEATVKESTDVWSSSLMSERLMKFFLMMIHNLRIRFL